MPRKRKNKKEAPAAEPCDLEEIKNDERVRDARLRYLLESKATPPEAEQDFWWEWWREDPFARLVAQGAFQIQTQQSGLQPLIPNAAQSEILDWCSWCWCRRIVPKMKVLKRRKNGISTLMSAIVLALCLCHPYSNAHMVAHLGATSSLFLRMIQLMVEGLPDWMTAQFLGNQGSPFNENSREQMILADENGADRNLLRPDSAEHRENIARGFTYAWRWLSECEYWPDQQAVYGALPGSFVQEGDGFPSLEMEETTGRHRHSQFTTGYFESKDNPEEGEKVFFFAWYSLESSRRPLRDKTEAEFWAEVRANSPELYQRFKAHGCDAEQANWYLFMQAQYLKRGTSLDLFRCDYPFDLSEAFLGAGASVFDTKRMKEDTDRALEWKPGTLESMLPASAPLDGWHGRVPRFVRARLFTDEENGYAAPCWVEDEFSGQWLVWELARARHCHVIAADLAEDKEQIKNDRNSGDNTSLGAWRVTYEAATDEPVISQCCEFTGKMDAVEAAKHAKALAVMYHGEGGQQAPVIFERNNQGVAFIEEGKRCQMEFYIEQRTGSLDERMKHLGIQATKGEEGEGSKIRLVLQAVVAFRSGRVRIHSPLMLEEMQWYEKDGRGRYRGIKGKDDRVSQFYLAVECVRFVNMDQVIAMPIAGSGGAPVAGDAMTAEEREKKLDDEWERFFRQVDGKAITGGRSAVDAGI